MNKIVTFALCFVIVDSLYDGDPCTHNRSNSKGICKPIKTCAKALEDLKMRIPLQTCGFKDGNTALVCCPSENTHNTRFDPIPSTRKTTTEKIEFNDDDDEPEECAYPSIAITVKEDEHPQKSWKKCIELADSVFPCTRRSFNLGAKRERIDTCQHSAAELIVGGLTARENEFPHMAALGFVNSVENKVEWDCGGTLVSEQWILTAAHCLYSRKTLSEVSQARLGEIDLRNTARFLFNIVERVKHPDYTRKQVYNDIALVKMHKSVTYSEKIRPACLHVGNDVNDNKAIAIGFGLKNNSETSKSDELMKVILNKFTKEECSFKNPPQKKSPNGVTDFQICYGSKEEVKDTCQGDSGSPLQIYNKGVHCTYTVIGVTSIGKFCGTIGTPALYTRVSEYIPWIESVVWPN